MIPELPTELWLLVLSYLPGHYTKILMPINRTLYNIALQDISKELRIQLSRRAATMHFITEYKAPELLQEVRHINVRAYVDAPKSEPRIGVIRTYGARIRRFLTSGVAGTSNEASHIFVDAQPALSPCCRVEELTISVNNDPLPPSFTPLLRTIWNSFGPNLQKLKVELTNATLDLFFNKEIARNLPNLSYFEMHISPPLVKMDGYFVACPQIQHTLLPFAQALSSRLVSLTISSKPYHADGLTLFFRTTIFPNLRQFEITNPLNAWEPMFDSLLEFISSHGHTLEELTLRRSSAYPPAEQDRFLSQFPKYHLLPALRCLAIDVQLSISVDTRASQELRLLPKTAPQLRSLLVSDMTVDTYYLPLADDVHDSLLQLTQVQLTPKFLNREIIDYLMDMPNLEELDLTYWDYGPYAVQSSTKPLDKFCREMHSRSYTQSRLRCLRLSIRGRSCGRGHPDHRSMSAVARCLPCPPLLEQSRYCIACNDPSAPKLDWDPLRDRASWNTSALRQTRR